LGVLSLIYGVSMSKVVKFVRERTPFILVVYGAYICFRSCSSRMASDILSFIIVRSYSILSWFRYLSFLFEFDRRDVRIVMVDDTIISVGSKSKAVYVAFEPLLRRILYVWVCDVATCLHL